MPGGEAPTHNEMCADITGYIDLPRTEKSETMLARFNHAKAEILTGDPLLT